MKKLHCFFAIAWCMVFRASLCLAETMNDDPAYRAATDACGADVVFLGEPAHHGSSQAIRFKSAVAQKLIQKCGFSVIVFESSFYELLYLDQRTAQGEPVDAQMLLNGIGGIWADTQEFRQFGEFLASESKKRRVRVFGIDDQLSATADISTERLPAELSSPLSGSQASECKARLDRHLAWRYEASKPYAREDQENLLSCLSQIESASSKASVGNNAYLPAMASSLKRSISRDFRLENDWVGEFNARDESMFENYQFITSRLSRKSKIIVWAGAMHLAKSLNAVSFGKARLNSFGNILLERTRTRPFVIATSSLEGSFGRQKTESLSASPPDSLEFRAFDHSARESIYQDSDELKKSGEAPSRMLNGSFQSGRWSTVVDALVIFRKDEGVALIKR